MNENCEKYDLYILTEESSIINEPTPEFYQRFDYQGITINRAIKDYYSYATNREKVSVLKWIVNNSEFQKIKRFSNTENFIYGLNLSQYDDILLSGEMPKNLEIAQKFVRNKYDVFLLSNPSNCKSADFIIRQKNLLYYVEGKTFNGNNSLDHLFEKGCQQSEIVVINIVGDKTTNYLKKEIKRAFVQLTNLHEIMLFKGTRLIRISRSIATSKHFYDDFARIWTASK